MTRTEFDVWLSTLPHETCEDAIIWLVSHPEWSLEHAWRECQRGDWLAWLLAWSYVPVDRYLPALYAAVDRACRIYAPTDLNHAGMHDHAVRLRALAPIIDKASAQDAFITVFAVAASAGNAAAFYAAYAAEAVASVANVDAADAIVFAASAAATNTTAYDVFAYPHIDELAQSAQEIKALISWANVEPTLKHWSEIYEPLKTKE